MGVLLFLFVSDPSVVPEVPYSFQRSIASPVQGEVAFAEQMTEGLYSYRIPSVG